MTFITIDHMKDAGRMAHQERPRAVNAALRRFVATSAQARHAVR
jgi:hypothetical protein